MGWGEGCGVGVECWVSWLVIRSSLPPRSLQGRPAWHSLRHQREDVRWTMRVWEKETEREGAVKSQSAWEIRGDEEKELREKRDAQKHINRERRETVRDTDPNANWEADIQEVRANTTTKCGCRSVGWAHRVSKLGTAAQSNHTELYKISCWSMEKWVQPQQSIEYWQTPAGLWICFSVFLWASTAKTYFPCYVNYIWLYDVIFKVFCHLIIWLSNCKCFFVLRCPEEKTENLKCYKIVKKKYAPPRAQGNTFILLQPCWLVNISHW